MRVILILLVAVFTIPAGCVAAMDDNTEDDEESECGGPSMQAQFVFDIEHDLVNEGDWRINFVPIPNWKLEDIEEAKAYFAGMIEQYISAKALCGPASNFEIVNGPVATRPECDAYTMCIRDWQQDGTMSFNAFHYIYMTQNDPGDERPNYCYPKQCKVTGGACRFIIDCEYDSQNPQYIVLDKLDSTSDVYYSKPITIPWNHAGNVTWTTFPEESEYQLLLTTFDAAEPNRLIIAFEGQ